MSRYEALDTFMSLYLGPDSHYLSGATDIGQSIDFYMESEDDESKYELLLDIMTFITQYDVDFKEKFNNRYRHSIHMKDDVKNFMILVNDKIHHALGIPVVPLYFPPEKLPVVSVTNVNISRGPRLLGGTARNLRAGTLVPIKPIIVSEESSEYLVQAVASLEKSHSLVLSKTSKGIMIAEVAGTALPIVSGKKATLRKARSAVRMAVSGAVLKRDKQRS